MIVSKLPTPLLALTVLSSGALPLAAQQWIDSTLPSGLVAWWQAEGDAQDSAGTHHGSGSTAPTYATGRFGQAFHFDGAGQSITISDTHPDLDNWTQFTLEAWVSMDQTNDVASGFPGRAIFSKVGGSGGNFGYQFGFSNNSQSLFLRFNADGQAWPTYSATANLPQPLPANVWQHVAASYDHDTIRLYLNGVLVGANQVGPVTLADSSSSLRLAMDDNLEAPFAGLIDDARIYNRALTAGEIAYLYRGPGLPVTTGLKLWFDASNLHAGGGNPVEGDPVTTWNDLSGNNLNANSNPNPPVYRTDALNGRAGVDFSGNPADAMSTAYSAELNFTSATMIMVANSLLSSTHVSISGPGVTHEFILYNEGIYHHEAPFLFTTLKHQNRPPGYFLQAGLFGVKATELTNYINGIRSTASLTYGQQMVPTGSVADFQSIDRQAILGWRNSDANGGPPYSFENLNGVLCEVLVYNRQLDPAELDAIDCHLAAKYGLPVMPIPPVLMAEKAAAQTIDLTWKSGLGRSYQLQSSTTMEPMTWLDVGVPVSGTGGPLLSNQPIGPEPKNFFRLKVGD